MAAEYPLLGGACLAGGARCCHCCSPGVCLAHAVGAPAPRALPPPLIDVASPGPPPTRCSRGRRFWRYGWRLSRGPVRGVEGGVCRAGLRRRLSGDTALAEAERGTRAIAVHLASLTTSPGELRANVRGFFAVGTIPTHARNRQGPMWASSYALGIFNGRPPCCSEAGAAVHRELTGRQLEPFIATCRCEPRRFFPAEAYHKTL